MRQQRVHYGLAIFESRDATDNIDIANNLLAAADTPRDLQPHDLRQRAQDRGNSLGLILGLWEQRAILMARQELQPFEDVFLALRAKAGERCNRASLSGGLQLVQRAD